MANASQKLRRAHGHRELRKTSMQEDAGLRELTDSIKSLFSVSDPASHQRLPEAGTKTQRKPMIRTVVETTSQTTVATHLAKKIIAARGVSSATSFDNKIDNPKVKQLANSSSNFSSASLSPADSGISAPTRVAASALPFAGKLENPTVRQLPMADIVLDEDEDSNHSKPSIGAAPPIANLSAVNITFSAAESTNDAQKVELEKRQRALELEVEELKKQLLNNEAKLERKATSDEKPPPALRRSGQERTQRETPTVVTHAVTVAPADTPRQFPRVRDRATVTDVAHSLQALAIRPQTHLVKRPIEKKAEAFREVDREQVPLQRWARNKQSTSRTKFDTFDDSRHKIYIQDSFTDLAEEDAAEVKILKAEDEAARVEAETPVAPKLPKAIKPKPSLASAFWGAMVVQDVALENLQ